MFYTLSSRLLVPPNTIFVTEHTIGYFVNVLRDWLIVILSLECYIAICIDWLQAYVHFTALCFSRVEVRFDVSLIKELIDWSWIKHHLEACDNGNPHDVFNLVSISTIWSTLFLIWNIYAMAKVAVSEILCYVQNNFSKFLRAKLLTSLVGFYRDDDDDYYY